MHAWNLHFYARSSAIWKRTSVASINPRYNGQVKNPRSRLRYRDDSVVSRLILSRAPQKSLEARCRISAVEAPKAVLAAGITSCPDRQTLPPFFCFADPITKGGLKRKAPWETIGNERFLCHWSRFYELLEVSSPRRVTRQFETRWSAVVVLYNTVATEMMKTRIGIKFSVYDRECYNSLYTNFIRSSIISSVTGLCSTKCSKSLRRDKLLDISKLVLLYDTLTTEIVRIRIEINSPVPTHDREL